MSGQLNRDSRDVRYEQDFPHRVCRGCLADWVRESCTFARYEAAASIGEAILLPNVKGRLDHMDIDVKGRRLFVAGLENGTVEVVDLQAGKWVRSLPGFKKPQGALFVFQLNKLFVASGDDGMIRFFREDTLQLLDSIQLELGPNRVVYEPKSKLVYVGYGGKDAGKDYGEIGIIDALQDKHVGDERGLQE
jgi:hypothetical protein